ncbi:hypothetical protein ACFL1X_09440 [Candidatus Hydrogenedentota bacterium]
MFILAALPVFFLACANLAHSYDPSVPLTSACGLVAVRIVAEDQQSGDELCGYPHHIRVRRFPDANTAGEKEDYIIHATGTKEKGFFGLESPPAHALMYVLPAGPYQILSVNDGDRVVCSVLRNDLRFTVREGAVTYLGDWRIGETGVLYGTPLGAITWGNSASCNVWNRLSDFRAHLERANTLPVFDDYGWVRHFVRTDRKHTREFTRTLKTADFLVD